MRKQRMHFICRLLVQCWNMIVPRSRTRWTHRFYEVRVTIANSESKSTLISLSNLNHQQLLSDQKIPTPAPSTSVSPSTHLTSTPYRPPLTAYINSENIYVPVEEDDFDTISWGWILTEGRIIDYNFFELVFIHNMKFSYHISFSYHLSLLIPPMLSTIWRQRRWMSHDVTDVTCDNLLFCSFPSPLTTLRLQINVDAWTALTGWATIDSKKK
jgi:hypothetical protein